MFKDWGNKRVNDDDDLDEGNTRPANIMMLDKQVISQSNDGDGK